MTLRHAAFGDDWWQRGAVYQVYPRSFQDTDGDGVGDLTGIIERLDHIRDLGVDALWLSPIYPSPGLDVGYDVIDHSAIDPAYGTMADFDRLVSEAHARGLRVILDLVMNHTSDQSPWFGSSRTARTGEFADCTCGAIHPVSIGVAGRSHPTTGSRSSAGRLGPGNLPASSSTCTPSWSSNRT